VLLVRKRREEGEGFSRKQNADFVIRLKNEIKANDDNRHFSLETREREYWEGKVFDVKGI